ncbi:tetratricopeptide repeat protein [Microbacterium sp. G2-8]|uniref:tetratricopeptide repeat protein n=1 Tax=Microbacterium sp. G2-8 TaxID=2842454 RepID=UPI001C896491|nr:tetratricopeptide repeat protein [Microbacterium sp. G2-8]
MTTLDDIARQLREWRIGAGSPSYADIARRVGALRGDPDRRTPGRVTVYDCFREGRSRIDVDLVVRIAQALGVDGVRLDAWRARCIDAMRGGGSSGLVTATTDWPPLVEPRIDVALADSDRALYTGLDGSGKSQAAARHLADLRQSGRIAGAVTLRIAGDGVTSDGVLQAAAHALGLALPDDAAGAAERLADVLARRRLALLIDDATSPEQLDAIARTPAEIVLLATSRRTFDVAGMTRVEVPLWTTAQTIAYLARVIGDEPIRDDPAAARRLADLSGGLPLVVTLIAARLRTGGSLAEHARAIRAQGTGAVRAAIDAVYTDLTPVARAVLRALASGPRAGLSDTQLRAAAGGEAVDELVHASLATRSGSRTLLPEATRDFARDRALIEDPPGTRQALERRLLEHFCAEAWSVASQRAPGDMESRRFGRPPAAVEDPRAWLATDLLGAAELALRAHDRRRLVELSEALGTTLQRAGLRRVASDLQRGALDASIDAGDAVGEARARCELAIRAVHGAGDADDLARIEELARENDDAWTRARLANLHGILAFQAGDASVGLDRMREALGIAADAGLEALAPSFTGNVAVAMTYMGDVEGALAWDDRTLEGAVRTGDRGLAATALLSKSDAERLLGRTAEALDSARRAADLAEEVGDSITLVHALSGIGLALVTQGSLDDAIASQERAAATAADIGFARIEATLLNNLAEAHAAAGRTDVARDHFERARTAPNDGTIEPARALHGLAHLEEDRARSRALREEALRVLGEASAPLEAEIRAALSEHS